MGKHRRILFQRVKCDDLYRLVINNSYVVINNIALSFSLYIKRVYNINDDDDSSYL